ncbi:hypothetical protein [uncultured Microbulbifer sp.]|uniref:hypothetical protein n=1 Tax=uncultured Microbulbifer sp. TaxID=348147 RepID=UPI00262DF111|nr:hypothetical protein [uncultured Microbulbifer sp.]
MENGIDLFEKAMIPGAAHHQARTILANRVRTLQRWHKELQKERLVDQRKRAARLRIQETHSVPGNGKRY